MKELFVNRDQLHQLAEEYPTPFHLYDEKGIRQVVRDLHQAFAWNKGFKEYFAIKATPNPSILKILKEEGCGVDCASYVELLMAQKLGFKGDEIMFSSNNTPSQDYQLVAQLDGTINLDAYEDIEHVKAAIELPEVISCRYNPGGVFELGTDIMDNPQEAKFGMTKDQLIQAFKELKEAGVKKFGIHALLASNTVSNDYYPELARQLFELAVEVVKETGVDLDFVNLSGGIGVNYLPDQEANDIAIIGRGVEKVFKEVLEPAGLGHLKIYSELGRFILAPNGILVTKVTHKKQTYKTYLGVDASAVNLLRPAMYGSYHHITNVDRPDAPVEEVDVVGSLCENNDKFAKNRLLSQSEIGDLMVIHDTGAHGYSMGYQYNAKLRSAEILLQEDGASRMIRRAERPEDYFATLYGFDFEE